METNLKRGGKAEKGLLAKVLPRIVLCVLCLLGAAFSPVTVAKVEAQNVAERMWRLYNPYSGEHFYTASTSERDHLYDVGWSIEGYGWTSPTSNADPVYRLYNPNAGDHHYTMSTAERDNLVSVGWNYEGVGWLAYTSGNVPVYREYNPNATTGAHNFTTSKSEHDYLVSIGWKDEGIAFYAYGPGGSEGAKTNIPQIYSNGIAGAYYTGDIRVGNFSAHCYEDRNPNEWMAQKITDAANSAYVANYGKSLTYPDGFTVIADHASQGFQAFMYTNTLTYAGKTYTKVSQYSASKNGSGDIILSNGRSYTDQYDGTLCTYTCTNNSGARSVAYWR